MFQWSSGEPEDAVIPGGTCSGDGVVGAHEPQVHSQQGAPHVVDSKWNAERVHLLEALQEYTSVGCFAVVSLTDMHVCDGPPR
jgi:hypothetical protein